MLHLKLHPIDGLTEAPALGIERRQHVQRLGRMRDRAAAIPEGVFWLLRLLPSATRTLAEHEMRPAVARDRAGERAKSCGGLFVSPFAVVGLAQQIDDGHRGLSASQVLQSRDRVRVAARSDVELRQEDYRRRGIGRDLPNRLERVFSLARSRRGGCASGRGAIGPLQISAASGRGLGPRRSLHGTAQRLGSFSPRTRCRFAMS